MIIDKPTAEAIVKELYPGVSDLQLDLLLEASKGHDCTDPNIPAYRPWAVAAWLILTQFNQYKRLRSATGSEVEYSSPRSAYNALQDQQQRADADICGIPEAWAADVSDVARIIF